MGIVTSGDAARLGIGVITDARAKATFDFGVSSKLVDPAKVKLADAYTTDFVRDLKVLP
jgi:NitT/TauT family transport system substrate-binding protein